MPFVCKMYEGPMFINIDDNQPLSQTSKLLKYNKCAHTKKQLFNVSKFSDFVRCCIDSKLIALLKERHYLVILN